MAYDNSRPPLPYDDNSPGLGKIIADTVLNELKKGLQKELSSAFPVLKPFMNSHKDMMKNSPLYAKDYQRRQDQERQHEIERRRAESEARRAADKAVREAERAESKRMEDERRREQKAEADRVKAAEKRRRDLDAAAEQENVRYFKEVARQKTQEEKQRIMRNKTRPGYIPNMNGPASHGILDTSFFTNPISSPNMVSAGNDEMTGSARSLMKKVESLNTFNRSRPKITDKNYDNLVNPMLVDIDKEIRYLEKKIDIKDKKKINAKALREIKKELEQLVKTANGLNEVKKDNPDGWGAEQPKSDYRVDVDFKDTPARNWRGSEAGANRISSSDGEINPELAVEGVMVEALEEQHAQTKEIIKLLTYIAKNTKEELDNSVSGSGPHLGGHEEMGSGGNGAGGGLLGGAKKLLGGLLSTGKGLGGAALSLVPEEGAALGLGAAAVGLGAFGMYNSNRQASNIERNQNKLRPYYDKTYSKDFMDKADENWYKNRTDIPLASDLEKDPQKLNKLKIDQYYKTQIDDLKKKVDEDKEKMAGGSWWWLNKPSEKDKDAAKKDKEAVEAQILQLQTEQTTKAAALVETLKSAVDVNPDARIAAGNAGYDKALQGNIQPDPLTGSTPHNSIRYGVNNGVQADSPTLSKNGSKIMGGDMGALAHGHAPINWRNNNPGNLRGGKWTAGQAGYQKMNGGFAVFDDAANGYRAANANLDGYARQGLVTPMQIIKKWAPAADHNNPEAYAKRVAEMTGLDPNKPVPNTIEARASMLNAITQVEGGRKSPYSVDQIKSFIDPNAKMPENQGAPTNGKIASGAAASAVDDLKGLLGKNDVTDRALLQQYLKSGGVGMDPHIAAWCAGTVNAALAKQGIKGPVAGNGQPSQWAPDFAKWGTGVDAAHAQKGDVMEYKNGKHVGLFTGERDKNGRLQMIAGNEFASREGAGPGRSQVGKVGEHYMNPDEVNIRRANETIEAAKIQSATPQLTAPLVEASHADAVKSSASDVHQVLQNHFIEKDKKEAQLHDMKRPIKPVAPPHARLQQLFTTKAPIGFMRADTI